MSERLQNEVLSQPFSYGAKEKYFLIYTAIQGNIKGKIQEKIGQRTWHVHQKVKFLTGMNLSSFLFLTLFLFLD